MNGDKLMSSGHVPGDSLLEIPSQLSDDKMRVFFCLVANVVPLQTGPAGKVMKKMLLKVSVKAGCNLPEGMALACSAIC